MRTAEMKEFQNEYLEGYHFIPTSMEKNSPGFLLRAGLSQAKPNYHIGPKLSPYYYLIFVLKGKGYLTQEKKIYSLVSGDVFCLFPHITQEYYTLEDEPMLTAWIAMDGNTISQLLDRIGLNPGKTYLPGAITPALQNWLDHFLEWCRSSSSKSTDLSRLGWFYRLFELLEQELSVEAGRAASPELWLKQATEYMRLHYAKGITAEEVSKHFGIERTLFSKKFTTYFHIPPGRYLKNLKMEEAKRLLLGTDYELADIAQMVGYADLYSFSKEFKKSCGFSPSRCRPRINEALAVPEAFADKVIDQYGKMGEQWLQSLPRMIAYCESIWKLKAESFHQIFGHYFVDTIQRDGTEALLKLGIPGRKTGTEIEALKLLDCDKMIRLISAEAERGILLLEKAVPGERLDTVSDERLAVHIAAEVIRSINGSSPEENEIQFDFDSTTDWVKRLDSMEERSRNGKGPLPFMLVQQSGRLLNKLNTESGPFKLLHGNLHQEHILSAGNGTWLAISPKGLLGPPEAEALPFLYYKLPRGMEVKQLLWRAKRMAEELDWDVERLIGWCFCYAVWNTACFEKEQTKERKVYCNIANELWRHLSDKVK